MIKIKFDPKILSQYFNVKVRELCKNCKRYGQKATCPPYVETVDYYRNLLPTYTYGILVIKKFKIDNIENWKELGIKSSQVIHNILLHMRQTLIKQNKFAIIFGAGSCKHCQKCAFPCRFPHKSIVPIEATGINLIKLVKKLAKINLRFPVEKQGYFYRIGMRLHD